MKFFEDYNNWNQFKQLLNEIDIQLPCNERELWWISLGLNIGIEIDGKGIDFERPALIFRKFNKDHLWVIPLTRKQLPKPGIHMLLNHKLLEEYSTALLTQLQPISTRRLLRKIGKIDDDQFLNIIKSIKDILPKTKDPG